MYSHILLNRHQGRAVARCRPQRIVKVVDAFLSDMEITIAMHTDEVKYWQDIRNQLFHLQEEANKQ